MYLYTHVHRRIIHNSHKVEQSQVFINGLKNEYNVVYTYNGILFSLQKKVILSDAITWMVLEHVSEVKSLSCVRLFATPWTVAHQAPLCMGFSRQEHWSGLPFPSPGDLPDPGIEPSSFALAGRFFTTSATCEAISLIALVFLQGCITF